MKRRLCIISIAVAAAALSLFFLPPRALVWAPVPVVRSRLIWATHRGVSRTDVLAYLYRNGYRVTESSGGRTPVLGYPVEQPHAGYIAAHIGTYQIVYRADVLAYYLFDKRDRLIDVVVQCEADAP